MIGAPTASAGAILCAPRLSGKLKGTIPTTTPAGNRRTSHSTPAGGGIEVHRDDGSAPVRQLRGSEAKDLGRPARPPTRDRVSGFPASCEISWAISSARARSRPTMPSRTSRRFPVRLRGQSGPGGEGHLQRTICLGSARLGNPAEDLPGPGGTHLDQPLALHPGTVDPQPSVAHSEPLTRGTRGGQPALATIEPTATLWQASERPDAGHQPPLLPPPRHDARGPLGGAGRDAGHVSRGDPPLRRLGADRLSRRAPGALADRADASSDG